MYEAGQDKTGQGKAWRRAPASAGALRFLLSPNLAVTATAQHTQLVQRWEVGTAHRERHHVVDGEVIRGAAPFAKWGELAQACARPSPAPRPRRLRRFATWRSGGV